MKIENKIYNNPFVQLLSLMASAIIIPESMGIAIRSNTVPIGSQYREYIRFGGIAIAGTAVLVIISIFIHIVYRSSIYNLVGRWKWEINKKIYILRLKEDYTFERYERRNQSNIPELRGKFGVDILLLMSSGKGSTPTILLPYKYRFYRFLNQKQIHIDDLLSDKSFILSKLK